jgi:hypothetical protein
MHSGFTPVTAPEMASTAWLWKNADAARMVFWKKGPKQKTKDAYAESADPKAALTAMVSELSMYQAFHDLTATPITTLPSSAGSPAL